MIPVLRSRCSFSEECWNYNWNNIQTRNNNINKNDWKQLDLPTTIYDLLRPLQNIGDKIPRRPLVSQIETKQNKKRNNEKIEFKITKINKREYEAGKGRVKSVVKEKQRQFFPGISRDDRARETGNLTSVFARRKLFTGGFQPELQLPLSLSLSFSLGENSRLLNIFMIPPVGGKSRGPDSAALKSRSNDRVTKRTPADCEFYARGGAARGKVEARPGNLWEFVFPVGRGRRLRLGLDDRAGTRGKFARPTWPGAAVAAFEFRWLSNDGLIRLSG